MNPLPGFTPVPRKPYAAPAVRREARFPLVTAGSFDLFVTA